MYCLGPSFVLSLDVCCPIELQYPFSCVFGEYEQKGIGVQLGNIHQATKQKRVQDNTSFSLFK
jgi:hypothetical protein